jgi:hypothetical protein
MCEVMPRCRLQGSAACNITPERTHVQYAAQMPKGQCPVHTQDEFDESAHLNHPSTSISTTSLPRPVE